MNENKITNAILIDDEKHCLRIMELLLEKVAPSVQIAARCSSGQEGMEAIESIKPDLVFLDIEMGDMTGFDMLKQLNSVDFDVIFTTAYDEFAIDAFKVNATDYLLKPIDEKDLQLAIERFFQKREKQSSTKQIEFLLQHLQNQSNINKDIIALPTYEGLEFVETKDILYCQSDRNYTHIFIQGQKKMMISKTLKDIDELLPSNTFLRVHHSYTVNLRQIKRFIRTDGGYLIMKNGDKIKVARRKKELLIAKF